MRPLLLTLLIASTSTVWADDWPQWLGPNRDGVTHESGLVTAIPAGGLPVAWRVPALHGYSGPAIADGKVYLFEYEITEGELGYLPSTRDKLKGKERLRCLDATTGEQLWKADYACDYAVSYGGGPRCTPTVDRDRVYTLGSEGDLKCFATKDGALLWEKSFKKDYHVKTPIWGHSAHPLVGGDTVYCVVGGAGSQVVAFDKQTGEEKWKALEPSADGPGYSPPTMIQHNGQQQLLIWSPDNLYSLKPGTGELIWKLPLQPSYGMSIMPPQVRGDKIYVSAIGGVSVMMQLNQQGTDIEVLWPGRASDTLQSANVTPLFTGGAIYGCDCQTSDLVALSPETGTRLWATKKPTVGEQVRRARHGTAFILRVGQSDNYYLFNELGDLITARLTPEGYEETGRMHVLEPTSSTFGRQVVWSCPAIADGRLLVRNDEELVCLKITE